MFTGLIQRNKGMDPQQEIQGQILRRDPYVFSRANPKPRLRWTKRLHQKFVNAITQLGGPDKATPKSIMKAMGVKEITLYHLKSHLQKYRLGLQSSKESPKQPNEDHHAAASCQGTCSPPSRVPNSKANKSSTSGSNGQVASSSLSYGQATSFPSLSVMTDINKSSASPSDSRFTNSYFSYGQGTSSQPSRVPTSDTNKVKYINQVLKQKEVQSWIPSKYEVQNHVDMCLVVQRMYMENGMAQAKRMTGMGTSASASTRASGLHQQAPQAATAPTYSSISSISHQFAVQPPCDQVHRLSSAYNILSTQAGTSTGSSLMNVPITDSQGPMNFEADISSLLPGQTVTWGQETATAHVNPQGNFNIPHLFNDTKDISLLPLNATLPMNHSTMQRPPEDPMPSLSTPYASEMKGMELQLLKDEPIKVWDDPAPTSDWLDELSVKNRILPDECWTCPGDGNDK